MIARITRILLLIQLAFAAAIAAGVQRVLGPGLVASFAAGLGAVLLVRLAITANNFLLGWRYRSETPLQYRLDVAKACRLFFGEYLATMTASSWTMPFRCFRHRGAANPTSLPVLLIHGYACNSGYWRPLSKTLTDACINHDAVDLEPVLGSIDDYVTIIHRAVENICSNAGSGRMIIVAHSMGGLAARAYMRDYGVHRLAAVITLGTPHHGTALAHYGIGTNTAQMRRTLIEEEELSSDWIRRLSASETAETRSRIVSVYSHHDNIVAPQTSSHLEGAVNVEYAGIGHVALPSHPAIQARVIDEIRKASS
jgi:triacylglycerol lipase